MIGSSGSDGSLGRDAGRTRNVGGREGGDGDGACRGGGVAAARRMPRSPAAMLGEPFGPIGPTPSLEPAAGIADIAVPLVAIWGTAVTATDMPGGAPVHPAGGSTGCTA